MTTPLGATCGEEVDVGHQIVGGGDALDRDVAKLVDRVVVGRVQIGNHHEARRKLRFLQKGPELRQLVVAADAHGYD